MKTLMMAVLGGSLMLAGCVSQLPPDEPVTVVQRFYWEALARSGSRDGRTGAVNLAGLEADRMALPGKPLLNRTGGTAYLDQVRVDASTILVTSVDHSNRDVVEVVVSPHLSAENTSNPNPTPEAKAAEKAEALQALATHRYISVRRGVVTSRTEPTGPVVTIQPGPSN